MSARVDPISFEVIRNAFVAATDEMALALKRSAYSTNIKTRSDFSCAFFDADLRSIAQGFTQPVHLGSMVEQVPQAVRASASSGSAPATSSSRTTRTRRRPPQRRQPDLARSTPTHAHRLCREHRAPRRRRRRRARVDRRVPRGVPGGRDHPSGPLVKAGEIVPDVFQLILAQIRSKHETGGDFRAQIAANTTGVRRIQALVDAARPRRRSSRRWRSCSLHRAARQGRDLGAALRHLRGRGIGRQRWLHRRAGPARGPDHDRRRRRPLRHRGLRPAAARARQLDLRADLLGLRLRAQVPDRPRPAGQRRLLPPLPLNAPQGSVTNCTLALGGRRRLGDP